MTLLQGQAGCTHQQQPGGALLVKAAERLQQGKPEQQGSSDPRWQMGSGAGRVRSKVPAMATHPSLAADSQCSPVSCLCSRSTDSATMCAQWPAATANPPGMFDVGLRWGALRQPGHTSRGLADQQPSGHHTTQPCSPPQLAYASHATQVHWRRWAAPGGHSTGQDSSWARRCDRLADHAPVSASDCLQGQVKRE